MSYEFVCPQLHKLSYQDVRNAGVQAFFLSFLTVFIKDERICEKVALYTMILFNV